MPTGETKHLPLTRTVLQGSSVGAPISILTAKDNQWVKILEAPYTISGKKINAINIQHQLGPKVIINYADMGAGNEEGIWLQPGDERNYMVVPNSNLEIWVRTASGTGDASIAIERLAGG